MRQVIELSRPIPKMREWESGLELFPDEFWSIGDKIVSLLKIRAKSDRFEDLFRSINESMGSSIEIRAKSDCIKGFLVL